MRRAEESVLLGEHLAGPGEFQEHTGVGGGSGVMDSCERARDVEGIGDDRGVLRVGGVPRGLPAEDRGAEFTQLLRTGDELLDAHHHDGRGAVSGGDGRRAIQTKLPHGFVGATALLLQSCCAFVRRSRHLTHRGAPLGLEGGDGSGDRIADLGVEDLQLPQPRNVLGGGDGGEAPESQQRDDGNHQKEMIFARTVRGRSSRPPFAVPEPAGGCGAPSGRGS